MGFTRASILWAQDQVSAFFRVTMGVPLVVALVIAPISLHHGPPSRAVGSATLGLSPCHTTFSMVVSRAGMTARPPAFPGAAAILLLAPHACGRRFTEGMLHWVLGTGV